MTGNMLRRKLVRDMRHSGMQLFAIVLLCSLGTFMFAGLQGTARLAQGTIDVYFEENNLADFWVAVPEATRDTLERIRGIAGVEDVCARMSVDLESTFPGEPTLNVTGYDGEMTINIPIVSEGERLIATDLRGCLIQAGFAKAHGLTVGDRVSVKLAGEQYDFLIRGIVYSPEFICVTEDIYPDPETYGYILINASAMAAVPMTQVVVSLSPDADEAAVKDAIERLLPTALVLDRNAHQSTANAISNAQMFANLTLVFPIIAYAVAALIVMTTLTRMIDNQRLQLGTLKALGYPSHKICWHYLAYAIWPSLFGSLLGVLAGHTTLPSIIWALLLGQNEYPYQVYPTVSLASWGMVLLTMVMSVTICFITYRRSARETTASLLRPKPPKAGRRILLEHIGFLWRRFGFNTKMIVRNLMRNRMRTVMSFIGILCCNALIIASFGLQDSVRALAENHYTRTLSYDVRADLTAGADTADSYRRRLDAQKVECIMEQSVNVRSESASRATLLTVVEPMQTMLHVGKDETLVDILPGGVAITQKLANTLRVKMGDSLTLFFPGDDQPVQLCVTQIVFNSVTQGLYMQSETWENLRKGAFVPTAIQLVQPSDACIEELNKMDEVDKLKRPVEQSQELMKMLDMLTTIFALITLIALALAFVICYNMGLMNFSERTREYATLKVLGYHQQEIRRLILGENNLISVLGVLAGIMPGLGLTGVVLKVCETETLMYPSHPTVLSVVFSCLITYVFSILIQLILTRKVRGVDMVEALKSVE